MAYYNYKYARDVIPETFLVGKEFQKKHGYESDRDANYSGDYWLAAGDYIRELRAELRTCYNIIRKSTTKVTTNNTHNRINRLNAFDVMLEE